MARDAFSILYLPDQLITDLRMRVSEELSGSEMYDLERLLERAWTDGYNAGHQRGRQEGWDHRNRPSVNDVNAARERIREERAAKSKAVNDG